MDNVTKFIERSESVAYGRGCAKGDGGYGSYYGIGETDSGIGDGSGYSELFGTRFGHGCAVFGTNPFCALKSGFDAESCGIGFGFCTGVCLKSVNGYALFEIDGIPTGIYRARGNVAKGFILEHFATVDCYIVKDGDTYAHGKTLREAEDALREKIMESISEDDAIEKFLEHFKPNTLYKNREFFEWHNFLTGSCRIGRENFCANHGIDMDGESTPEYFIELTKGAYGGETIRKLEKHYTKRGGRK